jgi:hypothetical protein
MMDPKTALSCVGISHRQSTGVGKNGMDDLSAQVEPQVMLAVSAVSWASAI